MRTSKVLQLLAEAERKHALERAEWASERAHLLDRIMILAEHPMPEPWNPVTPETDDDVVQPDEDGSFLDELIPIRER